MNKLNKWDTDLFLYLNNLGTESWDAFWLIITDQWMSFPIYILLALLIYLKTGFKKAVVSGVLILMVVGVTLAISRLVKYGVMRPRPCTLNLPMRFPLQTDCGDYGFFSSHASVGMALMLFCGLLLRKYYRWILWPLMIWLLLFCYSRIYVGKHYPGDLIVGLSVGALTAYLFYKIRIYVEEKYRI